MSDDPASPADLRAELAAITAQVAAYVEWQLDTGALGAPRVPYTARLVAAAAPGEPVAEDAERSDRVGWGPRAGFAGRGGAARAAPATK